MAVFIGHSEKDTVTQSATCCIKYHMQPSLAKMKLKKNLWYMVFSIGFGIGLCFGSWVWCQKPFKLLEAAAEGEEKECFHPA
ncbi:hypothetical protein RO3G_12844 [Rhizopus delemar RA 99-880]|uniref:Uncharacterized protein n=1 Tax=Rhizopus delemar (strain RA 99-880 / ATCC MYA-4621 / FGSC 9543 / NRRL 43880) TaxID=246409 RepID=I1CI53_RHIO9|nr:hypothetical protein RO3G_12844 [Rhizopus delemar RA 99-880]|eukprot:EIE88133.1 hypothetical protein RO3G_12844 [Rhizopus delemar RA 99-880]